MVRGRSRSRSRLVLTGSVIVVALLAACTSDPGSATTATSRSAPSPASIASSTTVGATVAPGPATQQAIDAFVSDHQFAGMAVAFVTPDATGGPGIQYFTSGVPTVGSATGVQADTQFELGSESKTFTAGLLATLVASGRVSLDDPLQTYVPAGVTVPTWDGNGQSTQITIGDLATHQAALADEPANLNQTCPNGTPCDTAKQNYTEAMLWTGLSQATLLWQPGTKWLYSNWGWGILGTVLANIIEPGQPTGPYGPAVAATLTTPLGMSSTGLEQPGPRLATPYASGLDPVGYWNNVNALAGGGGLISDITDMATWTAAILGYPVGTATPATAAMPDTLRPISEITEMCQSPTECSTAAFSMGMAWQLYPAGYHSISDAWAFKDGSTFGMQSVTYLVPSRRIGITLLSNGGNTAPDQLGLQLFQQLVNNS
jgi:CubicO group peptidase (beta-lactamase class C family)